MGSRSECEIFRATSQLRLRVINAVPREPFFPVNHLSSPAPNRQNCPLVWPRTNNSDQSSRWRTNLGKSEARKWIPGDFQRKKSFFRENGAHYWYLYCLQNGRLNRSLISRIERVHDSSTQSKFEHLKREPTNRLKRQRTTSMHSSSFC